MWTSCQKEVKYHARRKQKLCIVQIQEGYIIVDNFENEEIIYYTSPSDGSYPIQSVNC